METTDEKRRGKDAAALSGGHLCHVCGYQYPNPHPSAKLRRSHRKHCGKAAPAAAVVVEEGEAPAGPPATDREEGNAGERTPLGEKGVHVEEGKSDANGGAASLGSTRGVGESAEDEAVAEQSSSHGTGVHHVTCEINENGQINCMNTEKTPDDKVTNSELSKNGLGDCNINSELLNEGNRAQLPIARSNGCQNDVAKDCSEIAPTTVTNPAEREDSIDEYQDASPFLHQSDLEDGALVSSEFPLQINNSSTLFSVSSAAANETSLGTDGLCNDQGSGEQNLNGTLSFAGCGASQKLEVSLESYKNAGNNHTDMVDNEPDKRCYHSESIDVPHASSLQEAHSVVLNADSQSTCSRKIQGIMEDTMHAFHNIASPTPQEAETSNAQLETLKGSNSNSMPIVSEQIVVHSENNLTDSSTELSTQNWPVKDTSDVQPPVENLGQKKICPKVGFQNNLPPTSHVDETLNPIIKDSCSVTDCTFEAMQQDAEQVNVTEENPSEQKTSGGSREDELCSKQSDSDVPTEEKCVMLPMSQTSRSKNPFDLDDDRNDDLFELPSKSCYLDVPSAVSRQEPTVFHQIRIAEAPHSYNSNDASSSSENGHVIGPKVMPDNNGAELAMNTQLADAPLDRRLQKDESHTNGTSIAPYEVAPMEFHTVCTQDTRALGTGSEKITRTEELPSNDMAVDHFTDGTGMKQAGDTTATETYTINVEAKKVTDDTAAEMNELQHCNVEENHADSTKDESVLQNMSNVEENKMAEDRNTKEMDAEVNADDLVGKWQADETSAEKMNAQAIAKEVTATALQSTEKVDGNKQTNTIVGQEGDNKKEEIAVTGGRLNSGRIRVPLKVLLAEASAENKVNKPSAKERVLSFGRRASKNDNSSAKSGSPKSGCDDHRWDSPAKLPRKDTDKSSKGRKQPWMPFICCHSVR